MGRKSDTEGERAGADPLKGIKKICKKKKKNMSDERK